MHVAVGGEGLSADGALVGPLAAVHQHVAVQRAGRAQGLAADAARVVGGAALSVVLQVTTMGRRGGALTHGDVHFLVQWYTCINNI